MKIKQIISCGQSLVHPVYVTGHRGNEPTCSWRGFSSVKSLMDMVLSDQERRRRYFSDISILRQDDFIYLFFILNLILRKTVVKSDPVGFFFFSLSFAFWPQPEFDFSWTISSGVTILFKLLATVFALNIFIYFLFYGLLFLLVFSFECCLASPGLSSRKCFILVKF